MPKGMIIKWTKPEVDFVLANYRKMNKPEILLELQKMNPERTYGSLKSFYNNNSLCSGLDCRFKPGHVPMNKGVPMPPETYEKIKATMFQKGNRPHNAYPVGTEASWKRNRDEYEYVYVKVAEPNMWRPKHHLIWEEAHDMKVPDNCRVIFLDGNRNNFEVDNLALITNEEHMKLNSIRNPYRRWAEPEEKEIALDIIRIESRLKEAKE